MWQYEQHLIGVWNHSSLLLKAQSKIKIYFIVSRILLREGLKTPLKRMKTATTHSVMLKKS